MVPRPMLCLLCCSAAVMLHAPPTELDRIQLAHIGAAHRIFRSTGELVFFKILGRFEHSFVLSGFAVTD